MHIHMYAWYKAIETQAWAFEGGSPVWHSPGEETNSGFLLNLAEI